MMSAVDSDELGWTIENSYEYLNVNRATANRPYLTRAQIPADVYEQAHSESITLGT